MPDREPLFTDEEKAVAFAELQIEGLVVFVNESHFRLTDKGWEYGQERLKHLPSCKDQIVLLCMASEAIDITELDEVPPVLHTHLRNGGSIFEHKHTRGEVPHGHHGAKYGRTL